MPVLGLSGSFSATTNTAAATAGGTTPHWNDEFLQATLSWPIYDAGIRYADRRSRDALANIAETYEQELGYTLRVFTPSTPRFGAPSSRSRLPRLPSRPPSRR